VLHDDREGGGEFRRGAVFALTFAARAAFTMEDGERVV